MIKTIIFDFGGVILDIDPQITIKEFQKMGFKDVAKTNSKEFIEDIKIHPWKLLYKSKEKKAKVVK